MINYIKHERRIYMKKTTRIILAVVITIISITSIILISNNVSAISGGNQGDGDCWGVDIFTDVATENTTTTIKPIIKPTSTKKIIVGRTSIKKVTIKKNLAKVQLKPVKGATGYVVKLSTSKKFVLAKTKKVKNKNCVIKNIKSGRKYYLKARAYKKSGKKIYYGKWSKVIQKRMKK